jgi:hypothetical protein
MATGFENTDKQLGTAAQGSASSEGKQDWDTLKEGVGEMAGAAAERGRHFLDSAREQATTYVDGRKDAVAQSIQDLAHSLRESCRAFEERPNIRAFVDSAAEGLDQLAGSVRARSFADIFNEAEALFRRRPMAMVAVTTLTGLLMARFIKSSADGLRDHDQQQRRGDGAGRQHGRSGEAASARAQAGV